MLRKNLVSKAVRHSGVFAVVASNYNSEYVNAMVRAARAELKRAGISVKLVRVPGAYEIPVVAAKLARSGSFSCIICLGVILRGETVHAQHIGDSVSRGLLQIQIETEVPVIHEVLLLENREQARVRCLNRKHNRGTEAAQAALQMSNVIKALDSVTRKVSA